MAHIACFVVTLLAEGALSTPPQSGPSRIISKSSALSAKTTAAVKQRGHLAWRRRLVAVNSAGEDCEVAGEQGVVSKDGECVVKGRGGVDPIRLALPEYESSTNGKRTLDRFWSNLARTEGDKEPKLLHSPGSVLGASALVAGTTVGAGVLALPAVTLPSGFLPSTLVLSLCWMYMISSGLLFAETYLNALMATAQPNQSILTLAKQTLGQRGANLSALIYLFIEYSLLVAYIAQGGAVIGELIGTPIPFGLTPGLFGSIAFTAILGTGTFGLYVGTPKQVELVNNVLVLGVLSSFAFLVAQGSRAVSPELLIRSDITQVVSAIPTMFVALVFHNIVPAICNQLEGNMDKIRKAIIFGTMVPLIMFIVWNGVILGTVDPSQTQADSGLFDPLAVLRNDPRVGGGSFSLAVSVFSELAIITSFIGFVIGLREFYDDLFGNSSQQPTTTKSETESVNIEKGPLSDFKLSDIGIPSLILIPPFIASQLNAEIFFKAIDVAGTFGVSLLFGVVPALMTWNQRYEDESKLATLPVLPGGRATLGVIIGIAFSLIGLELYEKVATAAPV